MINFWQIGKKEKKSIFSAPRQFWQLKLGIDKRGERLTKI